MIFFDSEVVVSPVVDFKTDSNLIVDDVVVIAVVGGEVVGESVSEMVSSLISVLIVVGRHS